ncbi:hypothetical protein KCP78_19335 [Salmonella enterica subsp. enterica]|nr:hypothetical protein KCP78_19335 [Salmonella enterica subsp. enterica]
MAMLSLRPSSQWLYYYHEFFTGDALLTIKNADVFRHSMSLLPSDGG